jgi:60 kDa SS-A/Ro ribonucleoprotein
MSKIFNLFHRKKAGKPVSIPDTGNKPVNTGIYILEPEEWAKLDTFLVLGTQAVMNYTIDHDLTQEELKSVQRCIQSDGVRAVRRIVKIAEARRASNNDPALFALALAITDNQDNTRKAALKALPRVVRSDEHMVVLLNFVRSMDGVGRSLLLAVSDWEKSRHEEQQVEDVNIDHPRPAAVNAGRINLEQDDWGRLDTFLLLGSESGTYYAGEHDLTQEKVVSVQRCIQSDGVKTVGRIVEYSESGCTPKNDPALFALALAAADRQAETRQAALGALPRVARSAAHLFLFMKYVNGLRGWGRALRSAITDWYSAKPAEELVDEAFIYRKRGSWTHRDALRLAHPVAQSDARQEVYRWITQGGLNTNQEPPADLPLRRIWGCEMLRSAQTEGEAARLISESGLGWETVPIKWLDSSIVWEALLPNLPPEALLYKLGRMTACGLLSPGSDATSKIVARVSSVEVIKADRIHPLTILNALRGYEQGRAGKGSMIWTAVPELVDALDQAFYLSFGNVEPVGKHVMLAIDVSNSMSDRIPGMNLSGRDAAAAMALITANVEQAYKVTAFTSPGSKQISTHRRYFYTENGISEFDITPNQRLEEVIDRMSGLPFARTDFSLPMVYAMRINLKIDLFCVYSDHDEMILSLYPSDAIQGYRQLSGINAKLAIVKMASKIHNLAHCQYLNKPGMMDVVGFDPATPQAINEFSKLG